MTKEKMRRPHLIDRAIKAPTTGGARPILRRTPPTIAEGSAVPVFFDLFILEVQKGNQWRRVQELVQGRRYKLFLVGNPDGTTLDKNRYPQGVRINNTIKLRLQLPAEIQKRGVEWRKEFTLSYQEAKHWEQSFMFTLLPGILSSPIYFTLEYAQAGQSSYTSLGSRKVTIRGTENQRIFNKCQIDRGLPPHTALLVVDFAREPLLEEQRYELSLYGWTHQGNPLQEAATLDALVSVAQLFQRDVEEKRAIDPETIINTVLRFSRRFSTKLANWLLKLCEQSSQQEPPCLIIVDHTSLRKEVQLEIPWEMLEIKEGDYQFLGASMQVVRWLPFRNKCWLKVKEVYHKGALLSYVDPDWGVEKIQAERAILTQLGSQAYESLEALELRMRRTLQGIGLVYIGCHGLDGNALFTNLQRPSNTLKAINLEMLHPRSGDPPAIFTVFLNACESVRITGSYHTDQGSFVEGFLANGVRGFIGTLASVDVQTASENAQFILELLTNGKDMRIAESLRLLRAEAVGYLQQTRLLPSGKTKNELVYKMLDSFMYVYYGDPLASLRLQAAEAEQGALIPSRTRIISAEQHEKEEA